MTTEVLFGLILLEPFVCLGIIAGATLPRRRAIVTATTVWLANQFCGYTLHNYPRTFNCLAWGLVLLAGTLLVTLLSGYKPLFSQGALAHHYFRLTGTFIGGLILFEFVILGAGFLLENRKNRKVTGSNGFCSASTSTLVRYWLD